jgi:hypothetical protein
MDGLLGQTFLQTSMDATINEPFSLSSYGLSKALPRCAAELKRDSAYVYSTFSEVTKNSDGYATITVHGDGVHVLDVSSDTQVSSLFC